MKIRICNHVMTIATVIANIMALIAVITGCHTTFGIVAASISLAVGLGMYLRVIVGTAALKMSGYSLMDIAVLQKRDPAVVKEFAEWVRSGDRWLIGARIVNIADAVDDDGKAQGYWLLMVGNRQSYERLKEKCGSSTVLDYWPLNTDEWASDILKEYTDIDDDSPIEELIEPAPEDMVPEKG